MKNIWKLIASKPVKHNKNADTLLYLLSFTKSKREKNNVKKGEKQCLGILYRNICRIQKINFQENLCFRIVYSLTFNWQKSWSDFTKGCHRYKTITFQNVPFEVKNFFVSWKSCVPLSRYWSLCIFSYPIIY